MDREPNLFSGRCPVIILFSGCFRLSLMANQIVYAKYDNFGIESHSLLKFIQIISPHEFSPQDYTFWASLSSKVRKMEIMLVSAKQESADEGANSLFFLLLFLFLN